MAIKLFVIVNICNDSLKMSVIRLDRNVSKNRRYLGFSKQRRALDGRDTGNESKRTGQIAEMRKILHNLNDFFDLIAAYER